MECWRKSDCSWIEVSPTTLTCWGCYWILNIVVSLRLVGLLQYFFSLYYLIAFIGIISISIDQLTMANIVQWHCGVLRREDARVLRRAFLFGIDGEGEREGVKDVETPMEEVFLKHFADRSDVFELIGLLLA